MYCREADSRKEECERVRRRKEAAKEKQESSIAIGEKAEAKKEKENGHEREIAAEI